MNRKNIGFGIVWFLLGCILMALACAGKVDSFWSGCSGGLIGVSVMTIFREFRSGKDPEYRKKMEIDAKDERNQYIRGKAGAYTVTAFILIAAVGITLLKLLGREEMIAGISLSMGVLMVLFFGIYSYLRRKE